MGLTLQTGNGSDSNNENPEIREDFYQARLKEVNAYEKNDRDKVALIFEVPHPDREELVEVGLFHSAAITSYTEETKTEADIEISDSALYRMFDRIGMVDEVEAELTARMRASEIIDSEVPDNFLTEFDGGFKADDAEPGVREREREMIAGVLDAQLGDRFFRVSVVTPQGDGGSLVDKVSEVIDREDVESDLLLGEDGDEEDAIFDEEDEDLSDDLDDEKDSLGV
jgi:hypothetical protein